MSSRIEKSCGEAGDVHAVVIKSVHALQQTEGLKEIPRVVRRLQTEIGWPEEVVNLVVKLAQEGNLNS